MLRRIELSSTSSRATLYLGTRDGSDTLGHSGHHCYSIHAVGPKARTKPAYVKVMDYYRPMVNDTQMYTIPEECLPRISHESNKYLVSDNLFNKAKSLTDSGEIIITNEFSFEDIPEGIPLEDPMYDNLELGEEKTNEIKNYQTRNKKSKVVKDFNVVIDDKMDFKDLKSKNDEQNSGKIQNHKKSDILDNNEDLVTEKKGLDQDVNNKTNNKDIIKSLENTEDRNDKTLDIFVRKSKANEDLINQDNKVPETKTDIKKSVKPETVCENKIELINELNRNTNKERITEDLREKEVENPNLSSFHVIDSEKDLEVPAGIEGPIPAVVLPPPQFRSYVKGTLTGISQDFPWSPPLSQNSRIHEVFQPYGRGPYFYRSLEI